MPAKGLHILIDSFKGLLHDKARLVIYGKESSYKSALSGYAGRLRAQALQKNIEFMGPFGSADLKTVFGNIDVLVVPSIWQENAPLVIQEAFIAGVPVIASRIGGIPELVADSVNGRLFEPGNARELKEMIEDVIEDPDVLQVWRKGIPAVENMERHAVVIRQVMNP